VNARNLRFMPHASETLATGDNRIKLVSRDSQARREFSSVAALVEAIANRLPLLLAEIPSSFSRRAAFSLTTDSELPAGAGSAAPAPWPWPFCGRAGPIQPEAGKSKVDWIHISATSRAIVINVPTGTHDHYPPAFVGVRCDRAPARLRASR